MSGLSFEEDVRRGVVESETLPVLLEPRKYGVILNNDDYTPMDFVVAILRQFFHLPEEQANQVMLKVHLEGKAVCGVFTRDVAETKVMLVNEYARLNQYPLLCSMEQV